MMDARGIVVSPDQDPVSPGRSFSLKLRGGETGDSIMMFEETIPAGIQTIGPALAKGLSAVGERRSRTDTLEEGH